MLETGTKAPDFELQDQNGKTHRLSDYLGTNMFKVITDKYEPVAIYFIVLSSNLYTVFVLPV